MGRLAEMAVQVNLTEEASAGPAGGASAPSTARTTGAAKKKATPSKNSDIKRKEQKVANYVAAWRTSPLARRSGSRSGATQRQPTSFSVPSYLALDPDDPPPAFNVTRMQKVKVATGRWICHMEHLGKTRRGGAKARSPSPPHMQQSTGGVACAAGSTS